MSRIQGTTFCIFCTDRIPTSFASLEDRGQSVVLHAYLNPRFHEKHSANKCLARGLTERLTSVAMGYSATIIC